MKHEVNVVLAEGNKRKLLVSQKMKIRDFILKKLFGDARQILVLRPGESVRTIKIIEEKGE